ncbi:MAG: EAL domain-containing protein [Blautia sp.]|nr:EAL domain-containing protein [Blautia sp.]
MGRNLEAFIEEHYKKALEQQEIQVFYQPVIRTCTGQLCGFEALARWTDPETGMITPDEFIPVMEREGLIHLLDAGILRQVCARIRLSIDNGETPVPVSVNLSPLDFTLCDIFTVADDIVSCYQIPHDYVCFEITGGVMEEDLRMEILERFRTAGYQIWMDDFGSAGSSVNMLKEFLFDGLKLDTGLLQPFHLRTKQTVNGIVRMARAMNIRTLSEGVETEEQFAWLRDAGCEKVQGYYFGRPMPYEEAISNILDRGIRVELPQDRHYYDEIGTIDYLSAVPFMKREEYDETDSARQLSSIPLALAEFSDESFRVLFYNTAFEETAHGAGMLPGVFTREMLCQSQPYHILSQNIVSLMDSVRVHGDGRMLFTSDGQYFEIKARCMARGENRYCALISMIRLTKYIQPERTESPDDSVHHSRRDLLTGLLNSRGIAEKAEAFQDEYYLSGRDFVRIHIEINDFSTLNEQYGFDFGNKVLVALGQALVEGFGSRSAIGRYAGRNFTVLQQIENREEVVDLHRKIRDIGSSVREIDGKPAALHLSMGFALFSEFSDIEEQNKNAEMRLHSDHDQGTSAENRIDHALEGFYLFDDLPVPYVVYHVTYSKKSGRYDALYFYVNHMYEEFSGFSAKELIGHTARELFPLLGEEWYQDVKSAALDGVVVEGEFDNALNGKRFRFTARQIIHPGYCAITSVEIPTTRKKRRILIADDTQSNREMLGNLLSEYYDICYASNGLEALKMLRSHRKEIALLILDLYMPNMTGQEVIARMQADQKLKSVPVIVLTVDHQAEVECLKMGAMDFIPKPYPDIEIVKARIEKCIEVSERKRSDNS